MKVSTEMVLCAILILCGLAMATLVRSIRNGWEMHDLRVRVNDCLGQLLAAKVEAARAEGVITGGDVARALGVIATAVAVRDHAIAISIEDVAERAAERKMVAETPA